jgi:hypothetical protein
LPKTLHQTKIIRSSPASIAEMISAWRSRRDRLPQPRPVSLLSTYASLRQQQPRTCVDYQSQSVGLPINKQTCETAIPTRTAENRIWHLPMATALILLNSGGVPVGAHGSGHVPRTEIIDSPESHHHESRGSPFPTRTAAAQKEIQLVPLEVFLRFRSIR